MALLLTIVAGFSVPLILVLLYTYYASKLKIPMKFSYDNRPSLLRLYTKAFLVSLNRKQGVLTSDTDATQSGSSESCKVTVTNCRFSRKRIADYAQVCGYGEDTMAAIPCYMETYFMPLLICLAASPNFRLSPLGLIHVGQKISVFPNVDTLLSSFCSLQCCVDSYKETEKGIEVNVLMRVYNSSQVCVWEGIATLLSRSRHKQQVSSHKPAQPSAMSQSDEGMQQGFSAEDTMPAGLGVAYAKVAGDWNPHHLWPWTARFLGYNKPIAHGMCTVAKAMAYVHKQGSLQCDKPLTLAVQFKRPAFLPGTSVFTWYKQDGTVQLLVQDKRTRVPQLVGSLVTSS